MGMCMTSPRLILAGEGPTLLWTIPEVCSSVLVQAKPLLMKERRKIDELWSRFERRCIEEIVVEI